jgi:hypothetical protein
MVTGTTTWADERAARNPPSSIHPICLMSADGGETAPTAVVDHSRERICQVDATRRRIRCRRDPSSQE